jgi:hypothetical protein
MTSKESDEIFKNPYTACFFDGRLVGALDVLEDLLVEPGTDKRTQLLIFAKIFQRIAASRDELKDLHRVMSLVLDALKPGGDSKFDFENFSIEATMAPPIRELRTKIIETLMEKTLKPIAEREPREIRGLRIESILKELDIDIMARAAAHKDPDPQMRQYFEGRIDVHLRNLAQYGINAKTFAEAQQQYEQQYGGGGDVQDRIRSKIKERRRLGALLEADRAALVKEFPDQEAFINAEYRKEQVTLRRSM